MSEKEQGSETGEGGLGESPAAVEPRIVRAKRLWFFKVVLLGFVVAILVFFLVPTATRIAAGLRYPYQLDSEEGFVLWQAWQLRHGRNIFRRLDSPPYVAATYAPLYPLVNAALLWGKKPSLFGGRAVAAVSLLAICLFMALIVWGETRQVLAAVLGVLLFLNSYDVYHWLPFYRVDFSAIALGMAGLWLVAGRGEESPGRFRAACACFVAMVYTKQVELAPLVAALLYLWATDRRKAWRLFRNVAGWGIAIAVVLAVLTRGQFLVHNIYYNANEFSFWQLRTVLVGTRLENGRVIGGHFAIFHRFFTIALVVGLFWYVLEKFRPRDSTSRNLVGGDGTPPGASAAEGGETAQGWGHLGLFAVYAMVASIGLLGVGKKGAATNYLIEPQAAWALFIALVIGKTTRPSLATGRTFGTRPVFFPMMVVLVLHSVEFMCSSTLVLALNSPLGKTVLGEAVRKVVRRPAVFAYLKSRPQVVLARENLNPTAADRVNGDRIVEMLAAAEEPVFSEQPIFAMLAGRAVYIQPFIMSELAREGKWDQAPVVEDLRRGRFSLLVTTENISKEGFFFHYTDQMVEAMRKAYKLRETLDGEAGTPSVFTYFVFEPRKSAEPKTPSAPALKVSR